MSSQKLCDTCGLITATGKDIDSQTGWGTLTIYGPKETESRMASFYGLDCHEKESLDLCPGCVKQVQSLLTVFSGATDGV